MVNEPGNGLFDDQITYCKSERADKAAFRLIGPLGFMI